MSLQPSPDCCPRFDPTPWDEREFTWDHKRFVRDRVTSFLHIPLNFGSVMKRCMARIESAGASTGSRMVVSDDNSLWGAEVYVEVSKDVPGAKMASLSGTFLSKVFEGPYRNMRNWIKEMHRHVTAKGKAIKKLYFYYTTCPKCAKIYGKNYVVILAQV